MVQKASDNIKAKNKTSRRDRKGQEPAIHKDCTTYLKELRQKLIY